MRELYRLTLVGSVAAALLILGPAGAAFAFHGGGVAHCDGCHSMHNSADNPVEGATNNTLLKGSDASSTCLNCHDGGSGHEVKSTDGTKTNQGGDFYWMTKDYTVVTWSGPTLFSKNDHGHNIVAVDYAMLADPNNLTAPGGTYPAASLGCNSCHDPHGKVNGGTANGSAAISVSGSYGAADPGDGSIHGNFRLLGDTTYEPPGAGAFSNPAPIATSSSSAGASTDYGQGMSEWCANCHGDFINDSHKHPAGNGEHLNGYGDNYNSYITTGDFNGLPATSYDGLVPFERGESDGSLLTAGSTVGPDSSSNVMCLTCHRAHASANANAGRWDFEVELLAESHALESADVGATAAVYYKDGAVVDIATDYDPYQRSLCNKCHAQD